MNSKNTTFEQQPIKTPHIARAAFNCMSKIILTNNSKVKVLIITLNS